MATPVAPLVRTVVLTEENKSKGEQVMLEALRIGRDGTQGEYTEHALSFMFLAALGAFGDEEQQRVMDTLP